MALAAFTSGTLPLGIGVNLDSMPNAFHYFAWRQDVSICYEVNVFARLKR